MPGTQDLEREVSAVTEAVAALTPPARRLTPRVIAFGVVVLLLYFGKLFFVTLISAAVIAFILEPLVQLFIRFRVPRGVASFLTCSLALLALYFASLGAYTQISGLIDDLPNYTKRISEVAGVAASKVAAIEKSWNDLLPKRMQERSVSPDTTPAAKTKKRRPDPPLPPPVQEVRIQQDRPTVLEWLYAYLADLYDAILAASFVPFLVYFMLSWRDHLNKTFLQLFQGDGRTEVGRSLRSVAELTRAYIAGNFVLGVILSVATTLLFLFLRLPYAFLVGPISGFVSLLPYLGLPLAIIPPVIAGLPVYERLPQYLILCTSVAFLHLLALNLLYPKIVGGRVHLNPLAVTIALLFWGLLWGGSGIALAIPITAGIKAVCDNVTGLKPVGRLLGD